MSTVSTETQVVQKKGFYEITTPAGGKAKLTRVTTALDWVLKEAMGAMSYYGGKLFAHFLAESDAEFEEFYAAWKASEFDPNRTLRARSDQGQAAHNLFEKLLKSEAEVEQDIIGNYFVKDLVGDDPEYLAVKWDRGVVEAYLDIYASGVEQAGGDFPRSEVRLWWTEHPIDECPEPNTKGACTHGFSGTCDVYFPHWAIDDLKTHIPGYRWSEFCQMAMYSMAAEQLYGAEITRQRIVLAHDTPGEDGKYYELQDARFLPSDAGRLIWELYKLRRDWGPKE